MEAPVLELKEVARTVLKQARFHAECYRQSSNGNSYTVEQTATGIKNLGWFICKALGMSHEEIQRLNDDIKS